MTKNVKGILGEKLGMTQVWDDNNKIVPVTVVKAGPCVVTQVALGRLRRLLPPCSWASAQIDPRKVNKPRAGHFAKAGVTPRRHLVELRTDDASEYTVGQELGPDVFEAGQIVDVSGTSKGKGFAGHHEAPQLQGRRRQPRCAPQPPQAGFDRRRLDPESRLQGPAHVRPHGWRHRHRAEPHRACRRHRRGPAAHQGRGAWSDRQPVFVTQRREGRPAVSATSVDVIAPDGTKSGKAELPAEVFDVQVNIPLIHQVVVAQLAAARQGSPTPRIVPRLPVVARKPYRQKGTGRARQGSIRAPQFAGGGVVHGPTPRGLRAAHAQEDEGRRPSRCPLRPGCQRPGSRRQRDRRR